VPVTDGLRVVITVPAVKVCGLGYDSPLGGGINTVMVNAAVVDPVLFVAVTTKYVVAVATVGLPVSCPLVGSRESPAGSVGATEYLVTTPVTVGLSGVITVPKMYVWGLG
jgi:hypothetical protein